MNVFCVFVCCEKYDTKVYKGNHGILSLKNGLLNLSIPTKGHWQILTIKQLLKSHYK